MNLCPGGPSSVSEPSIGWSPDSAELIAFCSSRDSQGFPISVTEPSLGPCLKLIPLTQCRKSQRHHKLTHPCSPFRRDAPDWAAPSLIVRKATRSALENIVLPDALLQGRQAQAGTDWSVGRLWAVGRVLLQVKIMKALGTLSPQSPPAVCLIAFPFLSVIDLPSARSSAASWPPSARLGLLSPRQPAQPKPKQLCSASSAAALSVTCCDPVEPLAVLTCFGSSSGLPTFCSTRRFSSLFRLCPRLYL